MVLDAMLLTLQRVSLTQQRHIVIRRDCTIGQHEDGVKVTNPNTQFELWLSGKTNYMVIEKVVNMRKSESQISQVMIYFTFLSSHGQP